MVYPPRGLDLRAEETAESIEATVQHSLARNKSWVEAEFIGLDLGDKRLNDRLLRLTQQLTSQPTASINQACEDWADTKAAYRFFQNPRVDVSQIRLPHQQRTQERMRAYPLVLAIQDSTLLDYSSHPQTTGLGPIGTTAQQTRGLVMHTTLVMTPDGLPLGILSQQGWARADEPAELTKRQKQQRPIEDKESVKWLTALRDTTAQTPVGVEVVSVGDREADVYELFVEAEKLQTGLLVRAAQERSLMPPEQGPMWDNVASQPVIGSYPVAVAAKKNEAARTATVTIRYAPVTLKPPYRPKPPEDTDPLPPVKLVAILVTEVAPPAQATPLEWKLLTNYPTLTPDEVLERIEWYCHRWLIEIFHKILKSGCKVEECRLQSEERLQPYLAVQSIVAWRILWLTQIHRTQPDAPCTLVLADHEWQALYAISRHTAVPSPTVPTVHEALLWIAQLGGFLGRKNDGFPGCTVIWRGWKRLADLAQMWLLFHPKDVGNS